MMFIAKAIKNSALKLLLCSSVFLISVFKAHADTTLTIAEAFNIRAINGKTFSQGLFQQNSSLALRPGLNRIALEYEEVFESEDDDNFDIVKSNVFLLEIYLKANRQYAQKVVRPHNAKAAKLYTINPLFEIVEIDNSENKIDSISFKLKNLASNQANVIADATRLRRNATLNLSHSDTKSTKLLAKMERGSTKSHSTATKMLTYWWQQATPEEREAFLQSVSN